MDEVGKVSWYSMLKNSKNYTLMVVEGGVVLAFDPEEAIDRNGWNLIVQCLTCTICEL